MPVCVIRLVELAVVLLCPSCKYAAAHLISHRGQQRAGLKDEKVQFSSLPLTQRHRTQGAVHEQSLCATFLS